MESTTGYTFTPFVRYLLQGDVWYTRCPDSLTLVFNKVDKMDSRIVFLTRRGPCQHGFMCGCEQWSNNISESNYNMQPITITFAVRVRKDYAHAPCMFIWAKFGVRGV